MKKALITGITGQDGSYLAELLLAKGYQVHGLIRRASGNNLDRITNIEHRLNLHYGDMSDAGSLAAVVQVVRPDEVYNLAAMSHVRISYDIPAATIDITGAGFARLIEAVRQHAPEAKVYQAGSSEMFGRVLETPQTEKTPFYPRSPYGCAKAYAFNIARCYREGYGMQIYNGILFNHESPRRGENFLSRKVAKAVARIAQGQQSKLVLGNLDAKRDWGYAKEYVEWIWRIVQSDKPDDFVIATGETHTVQEFVERAFARLGMNWIDFVEFDQSLTRPAEVDLLLGDATKSKEVLGFEPQVKFEQLVDLMVEAEMWGEECSSMKTLAAA